MDKHEKYKLILPEGITVRKNENSPPFVVADLIIRTDDFIRWLMNQKSDVVRLQMKQFKDETPIVSLNHWFKPKPKPEIIERIINKEN